MSEPVDWDELICHLVVSLSRPWDEIAYSMDWPTAEKLLDYLGRHPPVHLLIAAQLGYKPADKASVSANTDPEVLLNELRAAGFNVD